MGGCCSTVRGAEPRAEFRGEDHQHSPSDHGLRFHDCIDSNGDHQGADGARVRLHGFSAAASMYSLQGWKGINQDAMTIWEDFAGESGTTFCGVFDGHGPYGHRVAGYVRDNLPARMSSRFSSAPPVQNPQGDDQRREEDEDNAEFSVWKSCILRAFQETDKELGDHATIDCVCSGSTAVCIVRQKEHLMIANLGDSRAILCTRGDDDDRLVAVQLTVDLKPNLPSEAERIASCKGRVFALEEEPDVHRIWLPDDNSPGLAMARAFGDFCLKDFGLISTPQVSYRKITDMDEFVVLATDGVWDVLSNEEVIKIVSSAPRRSDAAKHIVKQAVKSWRKKYPLSKVDDCAVICLFLKTPPLSAKSSFNSSGHLQSARSRELSFTESFKTAKSHEEVEAEEAGVKDDWTALEGVSRVNSLLKMPRFANMAGVLSWRKKSVRVVEEDE